MEPRQNRNCTIMVLEAPRAGGRGVFGKVNGCVHAGKDRTSVKRS